VAAPLLLLLLLLLLLMLSLPAANVTAAAEKPAQGWRGRRQQRQEHRRLPPSAAARGGGGGGGGRLPKLEVVEGCFNRFDVLAEVPMDPGAIVGVFNNLRCQTACGERGYALAATRSSPQACLCGNDYPSAFHRVRACVRSCVHVVSIFRPSPSWL
jgi:hypothetical protein